MTTKQELHLAIDALNEEQIRQIIRAVEAIAGNAPQDHGQLDLNCFHGVIRFDEDAVAYQRRIRNEWP